MRLIIFLLIFSMSVLAQAEGYEDLQHLSLFVGGTHVLNDDLDGETLGLDYEYRVSELLGLGFVAEHAFSEVKATTFIAVADIHSPIGVIAQVGPGIEFTEHGDRFLFRVGGLYEFEFGHFTLSPQFHIDLAENHEDSLVFGFAFGTHF